VSKPTNLSASSKKQGDWIIRYFFGFSVTLKFAASRQTCRLAHGHFCLKNWPNEEDCPRWPLAAWRSGRRIHLRNKKTRVRIPPSKRFSGKHSSAVVYKMTICTVRVLKRRKQGIGHNFFLKIVLVAALRRFQHW
jgi:hypothetical protein